ncbi:YqaE/Pmp3 family membrane protein [Cronobacter sakazakii]|nr:YqaE/Pmp3 family membrane protein [Cronobacter sakazakii]
MIFTIILPPLGVLLGKGVGGAFLINILLTLLGYFPGLIHAFWVQTKN